MVILNRVTLFRPTITFQQTKQSRRNQVMEANSLFFCKADLLSARVSVRDCQLVEPQPEYRERHPFPTHQHFNLVGLIDPRLMSAGDDHGLFLQVRAFLSSRGAWVDGEAEGGWLGSLVKRCRPGGRRWEGQARHFWLSVPWCGCAERNVRRAGEPTRRGDVLPLLPQVGCRPKELADKHETTKFRETPCLFKLLDGRPGGGGSGGGAQQRDPAAGAGGGTAVATLQRRHRSTLSSSSREPEAEAAGLGRDGQSQVAHRNGGPSEGLAQHLQRQQQQQQGQRWWRRRLQRALRSWQEGSITPLGSGLQAQVAPAAKRCTAPRGRQLWQALFRRWLLTDSGGSVEMQAPGGGGGDGGSGRLAASAPAAGAGGTAAELLSEGMAEVTKEWPEGRMQVLRYTSGDQLPCEKNWVRTLALYPGGRALHGRSSRRAGP